MGDELLDSSEKKISLFCKQQEKTESNCRVIRWIFLKKSVAGESNRCVNYIISCANIVIAKTF